MRLDVHESFNLLESRTIENPRDFAPFIPLSLVKALSHPFY